MSMACLQTVQFSCTNYFLYEDSSVYKTNYFPPTFKYEPSKAPLPSKHTVILKTPINFQTHLVTVAENPKNVVTIQAHSLTSTKNEVIMYFMATGKYSPYDCKQIHGQFVKLDAIKSDIMVGNKLAILYLRSELSLDDARRVFDEIPKRTLPLYAAHIGSEKWEELFSVLGLMVNDEMIPDKYLVPMILKSCGGIQLLMYGKMIHGYVVKELGTTDIFVENALIDFYANCCDLTSSRSVFDAMQEKEVVSWTSLILAYMVVRLSGEAYDIFRLMQLNGVKPDLISWNALILGFARNGEIHLAFHSLEEMQKEGLNPKVTSWNGLISGCVHSDFFKDALNAFSKMVLSSEKPNVKTIVSILPACAGLKALEVAKAIHGYAIKSELCGNIYVQGYAGTCQRLLGEVIKRELREQNITEDLACDRSRWRSVIRITEIELR